MRILFFSDHFHPEPSAPAAHVYDRCRIWARDGHEVTVITSAPNFPVGKVYDGYRNAFRFVETLDGVRVVRVKTYMAENKGTVRRTFDYLSYAASALLQAQRERRPDVVISTSPHLFVPLAGTTYARPRAVPHVFEVRDLWPASIATVAGLRPDSRMYRLLEQLELGLYRRSSKVICLSPSYVEALIRRNVPRAKIRVVVNGVNLDLFSPRARDEALVTALGIGGCFTVGFLGTVGEAYGLHVILEAAEQLRDENVALLVVGVGAMKECLDLEASQRGLHRVVFAGRQHKEDMPRYWSICDASLIHLKDDPLFATVIPSKIFESMAMGVPMIYGVPRGEGSAIVEACEAGLVIPPQDSTALVQAIRRMRDDAAWRCRLADNALASASKFSREKQAEETLAVLREATHERHA